MTFPALPCYNQPDRQYKRMMHMKLRNMTGIYLVRDREILLLYREGSRVVDHLWVPSAGGHFEPSELNDPESCMLRELREELGLTRDDLVDPVLRYIGIRPVGDEIRQNYYYFAGLRPECPASLVSAEGRCRWVSLEDMHRYEMPLTAKYVTDHYRQIGRFTEELYCAVSDGSGYQFTAVHDGAAPLLTPDRPDPEKRGTSL